MDIKDVKTIADLKNITRKVKVAKDLDITTNKSMHSLKNYNFEPKIYGYGKNYSYCDFDGADLCGCRFERCNFSFSINLDKAITDKTIFEECNLSGADLPDDKIMTKCNKKRFTDKEIEEMFKEEVSKEI